MSMSVWMPAVEADGSTWNVVSSAVLEVTGSRGRVRLFDRVGAAAGELDLEATDAAALLQRLGLVEVP